MKSIIAEATIGLAVMVSAIPVLWMIAVLDVLLKLGEIENGQ